MKGIIYKAVHLDSRRTYVGQTYSLKNKSSEELLADRKKRHLRLAAHISSKKGHFQSAIRKYGTDAFSWEILETAKTVEELNKLESFYIGLFDSSSDKNGFNTRLEGDNRTFASGAKRKMAASARARWENAGAEERALLLNNQQRGRDKNPAIRVLASERMRRLHSDSAASEKRISHLREATQASSFREMRSAVSKRIWAKVDADKKKKIVSAMQASTIRNENLRRVMQTPEYRRHLTEANRQRRKRSFTVVAINSGVVVGEFDNIIDAARLYGNPAPNISATLRGVAKTFRPKNPFYSNLGRLTACWVGDSRTITERFDVKKKSVEIFTADDQRSVGVFKGVRAANIALGAQIGSVLHGRTKTFAAKRGEFSQLGRLVARWATK